MRSLANSPREPPAAFQTPHLHIGLAQRPRPSIPIVPQLSVHLISPRRNVGLEHSTEGATKTSNQTRRHLLHHSERCRQPARRKAPPADPYLDARLASSGSCRAASVNVRHKEARANDVVDVRRRYTTVIS